MLVSRAEKFTAHFYLYSAQHLPVTDMDGLCDPFVRIFYKEKAVESRVIENTRTPFWD